MRLVIEPAQPDDVAAVFELLARAGLPEAGLIDHVTTLLVARHDGRLVGCAGLELYGEAALLRSVAVDEACRGQGIGRCLTEAALIAARRHGVSQLYLLTETAPEFFARRGFRAIDRTEVPAAVRTSVEFTGACCQRALAMTRAVE